MKESKLFHLFKLGCAIIMVIIFTIPVVSQDTNLTQRQIALDEIQKRPDDLWPRGDGHVIIAEPGSPTSQKGYHEPGGSFSPSPGSFGMSVWVLDENNNLIATSDNIPIEDIEQSYKWLNENKIPSISTQTPYYNCIWTFVEPGSWQFEINQDGKPKNHLLLVFRSVGPAGGPLVSATWEGNQLFINHRWKIIPNLVPATIYAGDEEKDGIHSPLSGEQFIKNVNGWGFVKLGFEKMPLKVKIADTKPVFASPLHYDKTQVQFKVNVPDQNFTDCLNAQVANLMMGYVGRQTCPGEPVNYPLA